MLAKERKSLSLEGADQLHYFLLGKPDNGTIVLATNWPYAELLFNELAAFWVNNGWQVLIPQLRSHVITDEDGLDGWLENHSRDIERMCEHHTDQPILLVGHSAAGLIGYNLLRRCPEVLMGMVSLAAPAKGALSLSLPGMQGKLAASAVWLEAFKLAARLWSADPAVREMLAHYIMPMAVEDVFGQGRGDVDYLDVVGTSPVPILFIDGDGDRLNGEARALTQAAIKPLRWARSCTIPSAGHFMMLDGLGDLIPLLADFASDLE